MPSGVYERTHSDPMPRFWAKVNKDGPVPIDRPELGPCWVWTAAGSRSGSGYGKFSVRGVRVQAHRFAVERLQGPIPEGMEPDHLCRNPSCVKAIADECGPAHLELVTHRENMLRGDTNASAVNARKTHCIHGHAFTLANTYITPAGRRQCRACKAARR